MKYKRKIKSIKILFLLLLAMQYGCIKQTTANFSIREAVIQNKEKLKFVNLATSAERYEWSFGDGGVSNEFEPIHEYKKAGKYVVTLVVYSKNNRKGSVYNKQISVIDYREKYNGTYTQISKLNLEGNPSYAYTENDVIISSSNIDETKISFCVLGSNNCMIASLQSDELKIEDLIYYTQDLDANQQKIAVTSYGYIRSDTIFINSTGLITTYYTPDNIYNQRYFQESYYLKK